MGDADLHRQDPFDSSPRRVQQDGAVMNSTITAPIYGKRKRRCSFSSIAATFSFVRMFTARLKRATPPRAESRPRLGTHIGFVRCDRLKYPVHFNEYLGIDVQITGARVVVDVFGFGCPDDDARNRGPAQAPSQSQL